MVSPKQAVADIVREIGECLSHVSPERMEHALQEIPAARRVFLAGAGRSALGIRGFAVRLMQLGKDAHLVGEATTPAINSSDLLIIGSGSGRTASLLSLAAKAKDIGARIMVVTVDPASPIAQLADCMLEIPAPTAKADKAVSTVKSIQLTGSLFEQCLLILLDSLALLLMQREGITAQEMLARHANLE